MFPPRRRLDLIDTERFWQKTYINKRYWQPHVFVWVDDKEIWLELLNYFVFNASLWPVVPFTPWDIIDIHQSYNLPSPVPPLTENEVDLSPVTYDWFWDLTVKQEWLYEIGLDFEMQLIANVQSIEMFLESDVQGTILYYKIAGQTVPTIMKWTLDDWTLQDWEVTPTGDPVTWYVKPEVTITHTFSDLSTTFSTFSWNKKENVYISKDEVISPKFIITPTLAWPAQGSITKSNFTVRFLRPNW